MNSILLIQIQDIFGPMDGQLLTLAKVVAILVIGYIIAKLLQRITKGILRKTNLDNRLSSATGGGTSPENAIAKFVYFLVMIFVLIAALSPLGLNSVLDPVQDMAAQFLGTIPAIIGAGIIGFVGYIAAQIASSLVGMAAGFLERLGQRAGLSAELNLTKILASVVFIFVFIPFLVAALDALQLDSLTAPLQAMLATFLAAIPKIISAVIIFGAFYIGGKFLSTFLSDFLASLGVNKLTERMGLSSLMGENTQPSSLLANLAFFYIVFIGIMTGVEQLGFEKLGTTLTQIFELSGRVLFGLFILMIGNFIAKLAYQSMQGEGNNEFLASLARILVLGLFLAISLGQMGLADNIINLAFGLTLGAIAVAVALSFGLGGREAAGEEMKRILRKFHGEK